MRVIPIFYAGLALFWAALWPAGAAPDPSTYLPGQLLVKFRPAPLGPVQPVPAHLAGARVKTTLPKLGWQVLRLPPGVGVPEALEYYRKLPNVAYAEPNYRIRLFGVPNDPRRNALWGLDKIGVSEAWAQTNGSAGIVVATLDTGLDYAHPDLAANVWTNPAEIPANNLDDDFNGYIDDVHGINLLNQTGNVADDDGHGTHVAGIIGAVGNNGLGVVGVNWRVTLLPVKIFSADDSAGTAGATQGYEYLMALKQRGVNVRVVNNSWGGPVPSQALYEAVCAAEKMGILTICAAGNSHHNTDHRPTYPAGIDCESLMSVAASTSDDDVASFSDFGALTVHLAAPGESVLSTYRGAGHYLRQSGTSMASPHVAGAVALLLAKDSSLTPAAAKSLLLATVDPLPQWQGRVVSGGRLNVGRAMSRLLAGPQLALSTSTNPPAPNPPRLAALSRNVQGRYGNGPSYFPAISMDGRFVAFLSAATNLTADAPGSFFLPFLHDRTTRTTSLAGRAIGGGMPNGECLEVRVSGDGRFVVFSSEASNLAANDNNGTTDVFLYRRDSGQIELMSAAGSASGNGPSDSPGVSADGRYVVFASEASNLIAGDNNGWRDIFLRDRQSGTTTRISVSTSGTQADYVSDLPNISADGRYLTFLSGADNLVPDPYYPAFHLYLRDRVAGTTERLSKNSSGQPGNTNSGLASLSADGRYVAFESRASNLIAGDTNNAQDIFLWDRIARVLKRISLANNGAQAEQDCWVPFMTADGRLVHFFSRAGTLCAQDDNPVYDVFVHDRPAAKLSRLTYNSAGQTGLDESLLPVASSNGQFVAFDSFAWNLVPGDGNGTRDVFLLDRGEAIPDLMIFGPGETNYQGMGLHGAGIVQRRELQLSNSPAAFFIRLDNDGPAQEVFSVRANAAPPSWAAHFFHGTTNLSEAVTGAGWAVTLPAASNVVLRLEVTSANALVGESWAEWVITASGTRTNSAVDAVRAVVTRTPSPPSLQLVSRAPDGRPGDDASDSAALSGDGRFVTFTSTASALDNRDYNLQEDVFLLDRQTRALECLSQQATGTNGNGRSYRSGISRDGRYVVFQSSATNLVAGDINEREDVFLFDRQTRATTLVSTGPGGVRSQRDSGSAAISGDGRYLAFASLADNFFAGDNNGTWDVFLRDTASGAVECLSRAGSQTANDESQAPIISNDGSVVVFRSLASNFGVADTNNTIDLVVWRRGVGGLQLLSRTADGRAGNDLSDGPSISDDNRYILFSSLATDLAVPSFDTNSVIFLYDSLTAQLAQINPPRLAGRQRGRFFGARLAPDGRLIVLMAEVADAPGRSNHVTGVFLYDLISGALTELSRKRDGTPGTDHSAGAAISADGRYVALASRAVNLIGETVAEADQLLLYDRASFQPDEWIRRGGNAPYRGQGLFANAAQRIEQTVKPGFTNVLFITIRNHSAVADRFLFRAPGGGARYFLQPADAEITVLATNAGWTTDLLAPGDAREVRVRIVANNTNLFDQDLVFTIASLTDPAKIDIVRLRLLRDDDEDGLPNAWEHQFFGSATNALAAVDSDGDGYSNIAEYIAGTDPASGASHLRITRAVVGPGPTLAVTWPSATNRIYTVERGLASPAGFTRLTELWGAATESSYHDFVPTNSPPLFYRIRGELP